MAPAYYVALLLYAAVSPIQYTIELTKNTVGHGLILVYVYDINDC